MSSEIGAIGPGDDESGGSPLEVVRTLFGRPLLDDDGRELLPAPRAYLPLGDPIAFWAVSIAAPVGDINADRDALAEALEHQARPVEDALLSSRSVEKLERGLASCPAAHRQRLEQRRVAAVKHRRAALAPILEVGLRDRLGLYLRGPHRTAFDWLASRAPMPVGLAVCERCSIVFQPVRKSYAYTCPDCHRSPARHPPLAVSSDGCEVETIALLAGAAARSKTCPVCGLRFDVGRSHRRECSAACKQRRKRREAKGRPIRDARQGTWVDMRWLATPADRARIRMACCTSCDAEYGSVELADSLCPLCEDQAAGHQRHAEGWCGVSHPGDIGDSGENQSATTLKPTRLPARALQRTR